MRLGIKSDIQMRFNYFQKNVSIQCRRATVILTILKKYDKSPLSLLYTYAGVAATNSFGPHTSRCEPAGKSRLIMFLSNKENRNKNKIKIKVKEKVLDDMI